MFEPKAVAKDTYEIKMYGTISQWEKANAADFSKSMDEVIAKGAKQIIFPTHSGGGSIYEGIAMGNKVQEARSKGIKTICRIEGLAASMAAVFAANCDETEIASNARMMVHEGRMISMGTVTQLRADADQLESLNEDIADVFATRTGKEKSWIMTNWLSGKDKWFNAQQSIDVKLADRKIPTGEKKLPVLANSTPWEKMAATYDKIFYPENPTPENSNLMKDQLIKTLGLAADATDEQINAAVAALKNTPAPAPGAAAHAAAAPAASAASTANDSKAVDLLMKIATERGVTDAKKLENIKAVAAINIDAAYDMLPTKEDEPRLSEVIAQLKGNSAENGGRQDRKDWTLTDWQMKDEKGLHQMLTKEPKKYIALFKAEHGVELKESDLAGFAL